MILVPFFENTLKNSHFALKNANFGVEISTKDLKFKVRPRGNFHQVFPWDADSGYCECNWLEMGVGLNISSYNETPFDLIFNQIPKYEISKISERA